jgi:ABC-type amino acid transport substrate-binding protein
MHDDELRARLRSIGAAAEPRPEFVDELHDELAARLGFVSAPTAQRHPARRGWLMLAAALSTLVVLAGGIMVGAFVADRIPERPTLLDDIRARDALRVAVRPDTPQTRAPGGAVGGAVSGYDIDVARAIGAQLGLRVEIVVTPIEDMLGDDDWDVAMPSSLVEEQLSDTFVLTTPYYHWPLYVVVPSSSAVEQISDLDGSTVCAVEGSPGESWLSGPVGGASLLNVVAPAPTNVTVQAASNDGACLASVAAGESDALVTEAWTEGDIGARPEYRVVSGSAVAYEPRSMLARSDGLDPTSLVDTLNQTLAQLRSDGTLRELALSRFGGHDLSEPSE